VSLHESWPTAGRCGFSSAASIILLILRSLKMPSCATDFFRLFFIWPILWSHSGPLCHALSSLPSSSSSLLLTSMRRRRATVATPGEWQCGVRRLAVANGPKIFQMLLVLSSELAVPPYSCTLTCKFVNVYTCARAHPYRERMPALARTAG